MAAERKPIKLFVIDDSAIVRQSISKLLENEPDILILGVAADPLYAIQKFKIVGLPDVIILDLEMPRMDGITFLRQLMAQTPIATIVCSSAAKSGNSKAVEALQAGAIEIIEKPDLKTKEFFEQSKENLLRSIKAAAAAKPNKLQMNPIHTIAAPEIIRNSNHPHEHLFQKGKVIAIGSSTGGVQVIETILTALPEQTAPIVIVQHMPPGFTASLAKRLNTLSKITVKEAVDGEKIEPSTAYIAQGDKHLVIQRSGAGYALSIKEGPKVSHHRPSVDILFRSMANEVGNHGIGIILTGMGSDGAIGLKEMLDAGAKTYAQDEKSCIVYGMPNEAVKMGGVSTSLTIPKIIDLIQSIR